ncbi:hypothetical protein JW992_02720 [candidate division KSB1 bacterium]|nr:hypothetical protein [candidate division KSB1 bacterium]
MESTEWIVDGHVHVYPLFDRNRLFQAAWNHLASHRTSDRFRLALLLTERSDCAFFSELRQNPSLVPGWRVKKTAESESLHLINSEGQALTVVAGRQIVTRDGLEICALATEATLPDRGCDSAEAIETLIRADAIVSLNWAPGKWFFKRGKIVDKLFRRFSTTDLVISDTSMRPSLWPTPVKMRRALQQGYTVVAGSDPLPFSGEEDRVGCYAFQLQGANDPEHPARALRQALKTIKVQRVGHRSGTTDFIGRQFRIMKEKKQRQ